MSKRSLLGAALLAGAAFWATGSNATTLYLGVSIDGGSITTLATGATSIDYNPGNLSDAAHTFTGGGTAITVGHTTANSITPQPHVTSGSIDVTPARSSGTANIYISEIGEFEYELS